MALRTRSPLVTAAAVVALFALGVAAGWWWNGRSGPESSRAATEQVVRDYILNNPEILPQAMDNLRKREEGKSLASVRGDVERAFPGSVLGNPAGKLTLVEFSDFACTYCKRSVADVEALIAANPDLKVVVHQLPILSPMSAEAAKMALAAARQGRYPGFHEAMFALGQPSEQTIAAAAEAAGLDMARARKDAADPAIAAELGRTLDLARRLGFQGTPSWVVGERLFSGAVGQQQLAAAIAETRS